MKKEDTEWEMIFAILTTDKEFLSRMYTVPQINTRKTGDPPEKWARDIDSYFRREVIKMAKSICLFIFNIFIFNIFLANLWNPQLRPKNQKIQNSRVP